MDVEFLAVKMIKTITIRMNSILTMTIRPISILGDINRHRKRTTFSRHQTNPNAIIKPNNKTISSSHPLNFLHIRSQINYLKEIMGTGNKLKAINTSTTEIRNTIQPDRTLAFMMISELHIHQCTMHYDFPNMGITVLWDQIHGSSLDKGSRKRNQFK